MPSGDFSSSLLIKMQTTTIIPKKSFYTQNGRQGKKYHPERPIQETAKLIKAEIKKHFPMIKTSVRTQSYAGGRSLTISVLSVPFQAQSNLFLKAKSTNDYTEYLEYKDQYTPSASVQHPDGTRTKVELPQNPQFTLEGEKLLQNLKALANAYRYDDSDAMIDYFDTNFYLFVEYDYHLQETTNL